MIEDIMIAVGLGMAWVISLVAMYVGAMDLRRNQHREKRKKEHFKKQ